MVIQHQLGIVIEIRTTCFTHAWDGIANMDVWLNMRDTALSCSIWAKVYNVHLCYGYYRYTTISEVIMGRYACRHAIFTMETYM